MAGFTAPPGGEYEPTIHGYVPGSTSASNDYDTPIGSQANYDPVEDAITPAEPNRTVFVNDYDPLYAFGNSPLDPDERNDVQLEDSGIDQNEDFVVVPVETDG
ncbi:hypothetical protein BH789_gp022 [Gordonia phage GMA6]|uniref:Uncharacterized protein n=1 Tax=Gordonia phage GMA6 TaxID=1647285 RepID=A0A0K0NL46_9CAUD|nr:hypothetical protein BH789_gp022 [Gordonia phage GMA6]AKL88303.1 hypothetical protein GMA6_22 [Gordonia phage GMA6]